MVWSHVFTHAPVDACSFSCFPPSFSSRQYGRQGRDRRVHRHQRSSDRSPPADLQAAQLRHPARGRTPAGRILDQGQHVPHHRRTVATDMPRLLRQALPRAGVGLAGRYLLPMLADAEGDRGRPDARSHGKEDGGDWRRRKCQWGGESGERRGNALGRVVLR